MRKLFRIYIYFSSWILLGLLCVSLNIINVDWSQTNMAHGIIVVVILGLLQGTVMEIVLQTIATIIIGGERRDNKRAPCDNLTVILNYNLLATGKDDILECLENMYVAYVGNLSSNVSAVLVSATVDEELKEFERQIRDCYRAIIYDDLYREGQSYAQGKFRLIDPIHLKYVWKPYEDIDKEVFIREYLDTICRKYANEFMVIHRVSRVLRKCGQYQDLMLISEGNMEAFCYCDKGLYGKSARESGQPLFHNCEDVANIFDRKFDYTLVLDADTGVPRSGVFDLLQIAAAHPERGIIQPAIKLHCSAEDTMFMHLEAIRQDIFEPMTNAMTALFNQSSYFGKALIKNKLYIDSVLGNKERLIERVPVDVLSHDTFEAALLRPLYAGSTYLLEAPSHNYVTWNIRERRWNRGEILLAMYFWKNAFGRPMRWTQKKLQNSKYNKTRLRTESKLDFVTSYIANSALRQMLMKPFLLIYVVLHISIHLRSMYASIAIVMFSVLVFPKFGTCNRTNYKYVVVETFASILQFTPEALVGSVRIVRALYANISLNTKWVPQRTVEEEFRTSNPFLSSCKHLWGYSLFAFIAGIFVIVFLEKASLILVMLSSLVLLPIYTGFTSLNSSFRCCRPRSASLVDLYKRDLSSRSSTPPSGSDIRTISSSSNSFNSIGRLSDNMILYGPTTSSHFTDHKKINEDDLIENASYFSQNSSIESEISLRERNNANKNRLDASNLYTHWPAKVLNKNNGTLRKTTFTKYDYGEDSEHRYVSIIDVQSPRSSQEMEPTTADTQTDSHMGDSRSDLKTNKDTKIAPQRSTFAAKQNETPAQPETQINIQRPRPCSRITSLESSLMSRLEDEEPRYVSLINVTKDPAKMPYKCHEDTLLKITKDQTKGLNKTQEDTDIKIPSQTKGFADVNIKIEAFRPPTHVTTVDVVKKK